VVLLDEDPNVPMLVEVPVLDPVPEDDPALEPPPELPAVVPPEEPPAELPLLPPVAESVAPPEVPALSPQAVDSEHARKDPSVVDRMGEDLRTSMAWAPGRGAASPRCGE
jgi:hypothetical protein